MNIDPGEYGIDVDGDEALRAAVSVAIAFDAWGERFRAPAIPAIPAPAPAHSRTQ